MLPLIIRASCFSLLAVTLHAQAASTIPQVDTCAGDRWPGFRGVGTSHTAAVDLPTTWGPSENVAWTVTLPGHGQSSPVIFGDRVFVTSIDGTNKELTAVQRGQAHKVGTLLRYLCAPPLNGPAAVTAMTLPQPT